MLAELIRLSKELYELEMIKESINIDDMIQKLYGSSTGPIPAPDTEDHEESCCMSDFDGIREEFQINATKELLKDELAGIIYESFSVDDVDAIRDLLTDYIEAE